MAYCTQAQVENRWASTKWWTDAAAAGAVDAAIVAANIGYADGDINMWAAQQYAVPLALGDATTAGMIADLAVVLTGHKLASRAQDRDALNAMAEEYKNKMELLKRIADGKVKLPGESNTTTSSPSGKAVYGGDSVVFTRDAMDGL